MLEIIFKIIGYIFVILFVIAYWYYIGRAIYRLFSRNTNLED